MYAIVETGGKQYRVRPGDTIAVERLDGTPGETLDLDRVLLLGGDGAETTVGAPGVAGAVVRAEVLEQGRDKKIVVFRYKSKVRYRRKTGHRQQLTRLRITDILLNGASALPQTEAAAPLPAPAASEAEALPAPAEAEAETLPSPAPETGTPAAAYEPPAEALPPTAGEGGPLPEEPTAEPTAEANPEATDDEAD